MENVTVGGRGRLIDGDSDTGWNRERDRWRQ